MKEFDIYLFDFDGTLVDSYDSLELVFKEAYGRVGVTVPEGFTRRLMRVPLPVGYEELHAPTDEESKRIFAEAIITLLDEPHILEATKTYEDAKEVLYKLHSRGKTLGIVSSNNRKHVREVLRFIDIDENIFQVIVGNQETKKHKPNPDPIYKGLELLGVSVSKDNVCYVGDGMDDMRSANNAGITPVLVDRQNEYSNETELIIKDLYGLLDY